MKEIKKLRFTLLALCLLSLSCKKYLDIKPDSSLAVPGTIVDLQLMMDNYQELNSNYPSSAEFLSDDYYTDSWNNLQEYQRDQYIWGGKEFEQDGSWNFCYRNVLTCNVVLESVDKVSFKKSETALIKHVKGSALFFRALYFYGLAQLYAKPFDPQTAKSDPGIVLRTTSDFNTPSIRANNEDTYRQVILDLKESSDLLPENQTSPNRPTKAASYGLLARAYLSMKDYVNAGFYAEKALAGKSELINYNNLDKLNTAPIRRFNKEVIFPVVSGKVIPFFECFVDSTLFRSYHENDLRRSIFFQSTGNGSYYFKGDYDGTGYISYDPSPFVFAGLATDEMFLIKAECLARTERVNEAMKTLNDLLVTRWKTGTYVILTASNVNDALTQILRERRKELAFRTLRWEDLRRLQNDPLFSVTPKRVVDGEEYTLPPNSPRYLLKIPLKVIQLSGIPQNP